MKLPLHESIIVTISVMEYTHKEMLDVLFSEVKSDIAAAADESEKNRYDVDMIRFLTEAWEKSYM